MNLLLPKINDAGTLRGKRVILRLDLDIPLVNGEVRDAYRLERAGKTLHFLSKSKAKTLIIGHIGRDPKETLLPIAKYLSKKIKVLFAETIAKANEELAKLQESEFVLLENLRRFPGETENNSDFSKKIASLGEIYVNDAFAVSHREHSSVVGIPTYIPGYAGFVLGEEVENLSRAFSPEHPMFLIIGGAKFETKVPLVNRFLDIADDIYICGALANDVYKARGYEVGTSLVSQKPVDNSILESPKVHVPSDVIVKTANGSEERDADCANKTGKIVDAGSNALADIRFMAEKAKFIIWNGPLGEYEDGFDKGTVAVAQLLAECNAETIIGGGDSVAVVSKLGLMQKFSFVSTGGGAMLEFLASGTLPGIEAIRMSFQRKSESSGRVSVIPT